VTSYLAKVFAGPLFPGDTEWHWRPNWGHSLPVESGVEVSPDTADRLTAVFACVRVIAETAAMLPLHLYRRLPKAGKERATDHPLYSLLHSQPNPWQTAFEFWEMYLGHLVLRGQAFAQKVENRAGEITQLIPLHPDRIKPVALSNTEWVYEYTPIRGARRQFQPTELMRTLAFSRDGICGRSVIEVCREAVGVGIAAEQFGASFLGKGVAPAGILKHPGKLGKDAFQRLTDQLAARGGTQNAGKTMIVEEGMDWVQVGMKLTDAQYVELRRFSVSEMARLFRVPPHMIMDLSQSTNNNIEHQGLEFTTHCEMPWLVRLEQTIWRDLLSPEDQADYFAKFNVDGLLRGDILARYQAFAQARQWGWLSADDVRELEDLNPLPDGQGETYLTPMNMLPADQGYPPPTPAAPPAQAPTPPAAVHLTLEVVSPPALPPAPAPPAATPTLEASTSVSEPPPPPEPIVEASDPPTSSLSQVAEQVHLLLREPLHRLARREVQLAREGLKKGGVKGLRAAASGHAEIIVRTLQPILEPCAGVLAAAGGFPAPSSLAVRALAVEFSQHWAPLTQEALATEAACRAHETEWPSTAARALTEALCSLIQSGAVLAPAA
jgi:HK97 family phage portal protein